MAAERSLFSSLGHVDGLAQVGVGAHPRELVVDHGQLGQRLGQAGAVHGGQRAPVARLEGAAALEGLGEQRAGRVGVGEEGGEVPVDPAARGPVGGGIVDVVMAPRYRRGRRSMASAGRGGRPVSPGRSSSSGRWKSEPPVATRPLRRARRAGGAAARACGRGGGPRCPRRPQAASRCTKARSSRSGIRSDAGWASTGAPPESATSAIASRGCEPLVGHAARAAVGEVAVEGVLAVARVPGGHEGVGDVRAADGAARPGR